MTEETARGYNSAKEPSGQGKNKAFIDNQWQPGQSGNPGGRPKDTLTKLLLDLLNANNEAEKKAIVQQLIDIGKSHGMRGQVAAIRDIFDRVDGKVPETHKIESDVPIIIQPTVYERKE